MKRMHLSRKVGVYTDYLKKHFVGDFEKDFNTTISGGKSFLEIPLVEKSTADNGSYFMIVFEDNNFEGKLNKKDVNDNKSATEDFKESEPIIKGVVSVLYDIESNSVGVQLEGVVEDDGKKIRMATLRREEINLDEIAISVENNNTEIAITQEEDVEEVVKVDTKIEKEDNQPNYNRNIKACISELFGQRFFGTEPSEKLNEVIMTKMNNMYLPQYLEEVFINSNNQEGQEIISRLLKVL